MRHADRMTRPKGDFFKGPAVRLQSDFAFGTAVEIIEYHLRQAPAGQRSQILDIDDAGRCHRAGWVIHLWIPSRKTIPIPFVSGNWVATRLAKRNEMAHK